jgi:tetratricopeptide (TPR) repeat protein/protein involved in polysaccharide export with SLBB domain
MKYGLICLVVLCVASSLSAQEVGSMVIVVASSGAKLKVETRVVGVVTRGAALEVREVNKDAFRVDWRGTHGWIVKEDVLPPEKAVRVFGKALEKNRRACDYFGRGNVRYRMGNNNEAIADFTEAIKLGLKEADVYYARGIGYGTSDRDKAIADFTEAVRLAPKWALPYFQRGFTYEASDRDKAIADFTEAIRLDPKWAIPYLDRGIEFAAKRDYDKAIADYSQAIALDAKQAVMYTCRGDAWCGKRDYDKAIADYTDAIRIDPACDDAYSGRGAAWYNKGDYDKAIADCSKAIGLNDKDDTAYFGRAVAYHKKGDYIRAIDDYTEVVRIKPERGDAYFGRGGVRRAQGDYKKAIADYTEAIRLDPKDGDKYAGRGWAYYKNGDRDLAIADCTKTVALRPDSSCLYEVRGALLVARGEYDLGIADIQKAIQLNPKDQAAKFEAWPKTPLSADAMRHGERQLRQMLKDRKAMEKHGKLAEPLYQWAIRKCAGEDLGEAVFWNAGNPTPHVDGDNQRPMDEEPGWIRVREEHGDGPELGRRSFEDVWCTAVFELYNIANSDDFQRLDRRALRGEVSRVQYVTETIRIESRAAEKTRSFYIHVFLPWAKQHKIATNPISWYLAAKSDPSEILLLDGVDKTGWSWLNYENGYDITTAWAKAHKQEVKEEIEDRSKEAAAKQQKTAKGGGAAASGAKANAKGEPSAASKRVEPLDVLTIWGRGTLLDQPIQKCFLVEPDGGVSLGPCYGRVVVKGMTVPEAEAAITKHLKEILRAPEVEVVAAGHAVRWPGETPKAPYHIRPNELLKIAVVGTFLDHPINGDFRVDAQGKVDLGEPYGSFTVKGLTLEEAEQAIHKHLCEILGPIHPPESPGGVAPEGGEGLGWELPPPLPMKPGAEKASGQALPPAGLATKPEADKVVGKESPPARVEYPEVSVTLGGWKRE